MLIGFTHMYGTYFLVYIIPNKSDMPRLYTGYLYGSPNQVLPEYCIPICKSALAPPHVRHVPHVRPLRVLGFSTYVCGVVNDGVLLHQAATLFICRAPESEG